MPVVCAVSPLGELGNQVSILPDVGIAALVATLAVGAAFYVLRGVLTGIIDSAIRLRVDTELEAVRARFTADNERLKAEIEAETATVREMVKHRAERYPDLVEIIYRTRNMARDQQDWLPSQHPQAGELAALALRLTNDLYATRAFVPHALFQDLHQYKRVLNSFCLAYNKVTEPEVDEQTRVLARDRLGSDYLELDALHTVIVEAIQQQLGSA